MRSIIITKEAEIHVSFSTPSPFKNQVSHTITLFFINLEWLRYTSICFISSSFFRKASCNSSIFKAIDEIVDHNNFKNTSTDKTVNSLTALRDCLVYSYIYNFIFKNSQSFFFNRKFFLEIKTTLWKYTNYKKHSLKAKGITKCGLCIRIVEYYSASILIHATAWRHYTKRKWKPLCEVK